MKTFIRSCAAISPQNTFGCKSFPNIIQEYHGTRLKAIEPDYSLFLEAQLTRRMSRLIKMGLAAALECLKSGNVDIPGAIITGTALGSIGDSGAFLKLITESDEENLSPTHFIQSTHNAVSAQIALTLKCHGYNQTYVHKGISFESALLDGVLYLKEGNTGGVLVGGTDEITDISFVILNRLGVIRRDPVSNLDLFKGKTRGTIEGEGAAFFLLSEKESMDNMAELVSGYTFYNPESHLEIEGEISSFLMRNALELKDIDLVITGKSGDAVNDRIYLLLAGSYFRGNPLANYKHLCGDYPTSSSFALWLACIILSGREVPPVIIEGGYQLSRPDKILIYNHYYNKYHSLMLVSTYKGVP